MLRSFNHLNDEEPDRHYFRLVSVVPLLDEKTTTFRLHKKRWALTMYSRDCFLHATITSNSRYNEEWDVRVAVVDTTGLAIADSKAEESKEVKNRFEVNYLIKGTRIETTPDWPNELGLFVEIKRREDDDARMIKAGVRDLQLNYEEMLRSGKFSDVTIIVQGKKFHCHRCILTHMSPVFEAMFEHDMKENITGVVTIPDVHPVVFQEFLLYLYTGNGKHLSYEFVDELYMLGDRYAVEELMNLCIKMKKVYSMETSFSDLLQNDTAELRKEVPEEKVQFLMNWRQILGIRNYVSVSPFE